MDLRDIIMFCENTQFNCDTFVTEWQFTNDFTHIKNLSVNYDALLSS